MARIGQVQTSPQAGYDPPNPWIGSPASLKKALTHKRAQARPQKLQSLVTNSRADQPDRAVPAVPPIARRFPSRARHQHHPRSAHHTLPTAAARVPGGTASDCGSGCGCVRSTQSSIKLTLPAPITALSATRWSRVTRHPLFAMARASR